MTIKRWAEKEEDLFNWLTERWAEKEPDVFWSEDDPKPKTKRWEGLVMNYWPYKLTVNYWYYIFHDLAGTDASHGHNYSDPFPRWVNWPMWGEWRYLFRNWKGEWSGFRWAWIKLTDETKGVRLLCRLRGHPSGEVYYNPGGDEPDHRCKDCGEEIG